MGAGNGDTASLGCLGDNGILGGAGERAPVSSSALGGRGRAGPGVAPAVIATPVGSWGLSWGHNPGIPGLGSQECRDQDVTAGASLCLVPEELPRELREIRWRGKTDLWLPIMIALRDGSVSYPEGSFHGRAEFQPAILSLCVSPVHEADSSVYRAEFENSTGNFEIFPRCFQVFLWDPILEPALQSQIQHWDRGWCRLSLLCSSPGTRNVSISWECPKDSPGLLEFPGSLPQLIQKIPENAKLQICHCNRSSLGGWRAAQASCTCAGKMTDLEIWGILERFGWGGNLNPNLRDWSPSPIPGFCEFFSRNFGEFWPLESAGPDPGRGPGRGHGPGDARLLLLAEEEEEEEGEFRGIFVRNVGEGGTVGAVTLKSGNSEPTLTPGISP
ncbi:hypothetical protein TURU_119729 [Turdus rufiventris]|nr:hypothetical protein TURU_119729 [Turdus rufiventris]